METRCNYGPTCQIPTNSEVSKYIEFKFQSDSAHIGSLNFNSNSSLNFEKFQEGNLFLIQLSTHTCFIWKFFSMERPPFDRILSNHFGNHLNKSKLVLLQWAGPPVNPCFPCSDRAPRECLLSAPLAAVHCRPSSPACRTTMRPPLFPTRASGAPSI
jgi:hypothetical protein